jgi:hypothetical protein
MLEEIKVGSTQVDIRQFSFSEGGFDKNTFAEDSSCAGYLVYPFLKMRSEQSFSIGLVCNFLKVYASIFDFLQ